MTTVPPYGSSPLVAVHTLSTYSCPLGSFGTTPTFFIYRTRTCQFSSFGFFGLFHHPVPLCGYFTARDRVTPYFQGSWPLVPPVHGSHTQPHFAYQCCSLGAYSSILHLAIRTYTTQSLAIRVFWVRVRSWCLPLASSLFVRVPWLGLPSHRCLLMHYLVPSPSSSSLRR